MSTNAIPKQGWLTGQREKERGIERAGGYPHPAPSSSTLDPRNLLPEFPSVPLPGFRLRVWGLGVELREERPRSTVQVPNQFSIEEQLLRRYAKLFRGWLVFKAHRPSHHSTLGSRAVKEKNQAINARRQRLLWGQLWPLCSKPHT